MPIVPANFFSSQIVLIGLKISILIVLIFYTVFALMIVRQVQLMNKTLISRVSPFVKFLSILNAAIAIGLVVLAWGIL